MTLKDVRAELLSRHLPRGFGVEDEVALLAQQPADKQRVIEERLAIIDRYLGGSTRTLSEAEAAAAEMGIAKRRFYRLLAKLREVGPVRALSPGYRNVARASKTRDGLGEAVEAALQKILKAKPDAKIAEIEEFMRAQLVRRNQPMPSESAIRRRVHALRGQSRIPAKIEPFGARLVVDQVALDLAIEWDGRTTLSVVSLVIDRGTRLICGAGFTTRDGGGVGLQQALNDSRRRIAGFGQSAFDVAEHIRELTWIVPPRLEDAGALLRTSPEGSAIEVVASGPRRHGDAILRLLGDRLGVHPFRRLAELSEDPPPATGRGIHIDDGHRLVTYCVDAWNAQIVRALAAGKSKLSGAERQQRLDRIAGELEAMFEPVFADIEADQREAREDLRRRELGY